MWLVIFGIFVLFLFSCFSVFLFYFVKPKYSELKRGWNIPKTGKNHQKIIKVTNNFHLEYFIHQKLLKKNFLLKNIKK